MSQELLQSIQERRTIRRFTEQDVEPEKLTAVLEAIRWSQSWANTQCWEIIVVQDKQIQTELQALISPRNPATKAMVSAPVVLAVRGKQHSSGWYDGKQSTRYEDWMLYDLGLATQNLCLAAHGLGLGAVVVGLFDHAGVEKLLGVPNGYQVVSLIPMGYPAAVPSAPPRKNLAEFVHYNRF